MLSPESKASVSLNLINFMFYAGISCIAPFLSLHMRALGLTLWHTIWVHVASGLSCILIPLMIGTLAERGPTTPRRYFYKLCFSVSLLLAIFSYTALVAVPRVRRIPRQQQVDFDCSSPMNAVINIEKCANWDTCADVAAAWSSNTRFRLSHCRYKSTQIEKAYSPGTPNPLHMCFRSTSNTTNLCFVYDPHVRENSVLEFISDLRLWQYTEYRNVSSKEFAFADNQNVPTSLNVCNFVPANSGTIIEMSNRAHDSVFCRRSPSDNIDVIKCLLSMQTEGKKPACYDIIGDMTLTFWMYFGLRATADAFFISALCLLEGVTLRVIKAGPHHRGAYGRTRIWPASAFIFCPIVVGLLLDHFSDGSATPDYSLAYFLFAAFEAIACSLIYILPLPVGGNTFRYDISTEYSSRDYGSDFVEKYGFSLEMIVISIIATFIGIPWGIGQVFDPLLYRNIGFTHLMLGFVLSLGYLCGIPFLWMSKNLIQNIGGASLVSTAFAFHSIHLAGLSFISEWSHWWWAIPFEAMKAFTVPILWLALVASADQERHCKGKRIALHYVLAVVHFGIGRMLGCSIGGFLSEYYSSILSYRAVSCFCLIMAIFYLSLHHFYMKPRHRKIIAARCALQRQSMNGSCLLLAERMPVNGIVIPGRNN